jgi:hypothetical protein
MQSGWLCPAYDVEMCRQTFVIGDVHGCYLELQDLLDAAGLASGDAIVGLGDIVDRGPQTPEVLRFFREQPLARTLLGNHERKHVRAARGEVSLSLSQRITREQLGETMYPGAVSFMGTLPLFVELPEATLVHGFFEPGIPLHAQRPAVVCGTLGGDYHLKRTYMRPWYELYEGDKPLLVGHHNYLGNGQPLVYRERVFGLDTACVLGGRLTGILLPAFRLVSVASRENYWRRTRAEYETARVRQEKSGASAETGWVGSDDGDLLLLIDHAHRENSRIQAQLASQFDVTRREWAKAYAGLVGDSPVARLMHLARRGQLHVDQGRRVLGSPGRARVLVDQLGLRK